MDKLNLELNVEEVNSLLNVLAELPTKTGAWPLFLKIQAQAKEQLAQEEKTES